MAVCDDAVDLIAVPGLGELHGVGVAGDGGLGELRRGGLLHPPLEAEAVAGSLHGEGGGAAHGADVIREVGGEGQRRDGRHGDGIGRRGIAVAVGDDAVELVAVPGLREGDAVGGRLDAGLREAGGALALHPPLEAEAVALGAHGEGRGGADGALVILGLGDDGEGRAQIQRHVPKEEAVPALVDTVVLVVHPREHVLPGAELGLKVLPAIRIRALQQLHSVRLKEAVVVHRGPAVGIFAVRQIVEADGRGLRQGAVGVQDG